MSLTPIDLSCYESSDGQITAGQNGTAPFTFDLSDDFGNPIDQGSAAGNFTFTGLPTGIYFVDITDAIGCVTTDAVELFEPDPLVIETTVTPISCFGGADGMIEVTQVSGGTTPYNAATWDDPNAQVGNTATDLPEGDVTVTVSDANGCEVMETFTLVTPPQMVLNSSYMTDTCGQGKGAAVVQPDLGTPPYSYYWKPNGITTQTQYNLGVGSYEVVVKDANGCADSTFVQVSDDLPYPFAAFDYRIEGENEFDQEVQFINNSVGTSQWTWYFGDSETSNEKDPRHKYLRAGDYLVQLVSSNGFCEDTAFDYVNIDPMLLVYVPNAFTPGVNGKNDYFFPQGEGIELESYDMFIYDRWGKMIWQTGNFSKKWDGTHMLSGKEVPMGTYVYLIKFREFADLDRHVYKGIVTLIRD